MSRTKLTLAVVVGALAYASVVFAQEHEGGNGPCKADREKFCQGVQPGGGRIVQCLKQHESELSDSCKSAIQQHRRRAPVHGGADAGT